MFLGKQPHSLLEVLEGLLFAAAARGNIQFQRVGHIGASLFENPGGEFNLHADKASKSVRVAQGRSLFSSNRSRPQTERASSTTL